MISYRYVNRILHTNNNPDKKFFRPTQPVKKNYIFDLIITGLLYEAKGLQKEAQKSYELALDLDPTHVPSLVSIAVIIRQTSCKSASVAKSFLTEALRFDRLNSSAWYNLGLIYKDDGPMFIREAANCFEAASVLEETEPIEPFR